MSSQASAFTDFGQKVDLTASIRNILRNYPEGTAVLKELVQNADDAGARTISFCLDMRQHSAEAVVDKATMSQFQGPALLAFNDAVFTEEDFRSIQRIGDSLKKTAEDQAKIGRFGIGFNAVYHWTDLPSFVSSNYLVMLDPQARFLPNVNPANPGKMVDWVKSREVLSTFKDQFLPYQIPCYNLDFSSSFQGTIFRLPLRTEEQAATSTLSKRALGVDEAEALLDSLRAEASAMLLFLKSVETIEIKVYRVGALEPELKFRCSISNISPALRTQRAFVGEAPKHLSPASGNKQGSLVELAADYSLLIDCLALDTAASAAGPEQYVEHWEVCNQLGGKSASAIASNPSNALLRLIPWGGLAACVTPHRSTALLGGLAYCFLPLPVQTGLPVMVNGFFELSSNRRDVWQAGVDMTGDGRTRAEWNLSLMRDVIGPSYVRLLLRLRNLLGFSDKFQALWPSSKVSAPWDQVVHATLQGCKTKRLLRVSNRVVSVSQAGGGGSDASLANAVGAVGGAAKMLLGGLGSMLTQGASPSSSADVDSDNAKACWIECRLAILLPAATVHGLAAEGECNLLVDFLAQAAQPVVECLSELRETLEATNTVTLIANPSLVRQILKNTALYRIPVGSKVSTASTPTPFSPPAVMCTFLLRYCLTDLKPEGSLEELHRLPALPLSNDTVGTIVLYSAAQAKAIKDLCGMGFSVTQASSALNRTKFDVTQAAELLMGPTAQEASSGSNSNSAPSIVIIPDDEEQVVFRSAASMLLARDRVGAKERDFLVHARMQAVSNIRPFSASLVPDLLRHILPPSCNTGQPVQMASVAFSGGQEALQAFICAFWAYTAVRPDVVTAVAQGPAIVPSLGFDALFPLSRLSHLICQTKGDVQLPLPVLEILQRLGVRVVDPAALPELAAMPKAYWDYVHNPSRSGVLSALDTLVRGSGSSVFASLTAQDRHELRLYLASAEPVKHLTSQELQVIKTLPLFTSYSNSAPDKYVNLLPRPGTAKFATVADSARLSEELFPQHFLRHSSPQDLQLLDCLGVKVLSRGAYFRTELLVNIKECYGVHREATERSILEMLVELKSLVEEDKLIVQQLQSTAFLTSGSGSLHAPSELFDPQEKELKLLLDDSFFPSNIFQREDILVFLRSVGLQQSLNWPGIIACARSIAGMDESNETNANKKITQGGCLLRFLDKNIAQLLGEDKKKADTGGAFSLISSFRSLFGEKAEDTSVPIDQYVNRLVGIAWVPTPKLATHPCMPWSSSESALSCTSCPVDTRPLSDAWLCSYTRRVVSEPARHPSLQRILRWNQPLHFKTIAIQLRELASRFLQLCKESQSVPDGAALIDLQDARETITGLIPQLYQRLNNVSDNEQDTLELVSLLAGQPWIWVGDTFVDPEKVALVASLSATPYLYQLPQDLRVYGRLLSNFKVKSAFTSRDYIQVLRAMSADHGVRDKDQGAPLSDANIDLACSLVTLLSTDGSVCGTSTKELVYIPDSGGRLALSTELVNDDVPWMSGPEYVSIRVGCRLIHPNISSLVAQKMGVKSLRLTLVSRSIDSNLFAPGEQALESFGQAESLTSRLRTILDMYPDGNPIFSELLQNADDAGASEVKIMLDENSYGIESLLDSKMAALQGPSLIVANDAKFTEADYRSLARIGHGSKLEKLATTGRFGLGFNSTYHLTDTPTFVSGDYLVVFDPHCAYAPGATVNQPGLRIKYTGSALQSTFRQQFEPFQFFGCDFSRQYQGTLFRFPLRSVAMAKKSEISSRSCSVADVQSNLQQLIGQLAHHLLFLRSVRSIEIYHCAVGSTVPTLVHKAVATVSALEKTDTQSLLSFFDKKDTSSSGAAGGASGAQLLSRDDFYSKLHATPDSKLPSISSEVKILIEGYQAPWEPPSSASSTASSASREPRKEEVDYLILAGLRGGAAKAMACDPKMRHLKLVPLGGVAACLRSQRQGAAPVFYPQISGQAFCFLPLPVQTRLPVHLNAYWELSSNRRDIWKGEDTKGEAKLRSDWNNHIMRDVLAPLYAALLLKIARRPECQKVEPGSSYPTLSLLPCPAPTDHWCGVSNSLFPLLSQEKLLWSNLNGGKYIKMNEAWLLLDGSTVSVTATGGSSPRSDTGADVAEDADRRRLETLLLRENLSVSCVPALSLKTLLDSQCVAGEVTPLLVRQHFSNSKIPHLSMAQLDDAIFLLQFAFRDINKSNFAALDGLPLLPLESGGLGTLRDASAAEPMYTVSDAERRLLAAAGSRIVSADSVLGPVVAACIKDPSFSAAINVKPLTPAEIVVLLKLFVPLSWFDDSVLLVDRSREKALSQEWLTALWSYILDGHHLELFENSIPLLPVLQPARLTLGSYVAKISPSVPVLHMTYKDVSPLAASALSELGIYIFDPSVLGGLSYSQEVGKLLAAPSPRGVLDALASPVVKANIVRIAEHMRPSAPGGAAKVKAPWSVEMRESFRDFVLDEVVGKIDALLPADCAVLCALPIWPRHGCEKPEDAPRKFGPIEIAGPDDSASGGTTTLELAPRGFEKQLLSAAYVELRSERDRPLYRLLGLNEPSKGAFYASYIIPRIASDKVPDYLVDGLVTTLLRDLASLAVDHPGLPDLVKKSKLIRACRSSRDVGGDGSGGTLQAPKDLYDPHVPGLRDLLPPEVFPSAMLSDPSLLMVLRELGLNGKIAGEGILQAARAIHADYAAYDAAQPKGETTESATVEQSPSASPVPGIIRRATGLVRYLEGHVEELLEEKDPEGLREAQTQLSAGSSPRQRKVTEAEAEAETGQPASSESAGSLSRSSSPLNAILGGEWSLKIREIMWIPAFITPPLRSPEGLPWPLDVHNKYLLAAPSQCCHLADIWLCSSTTRVSSVEVKSPLLKQLLGWSQPICGRKAALQLKSISELHEKAMAEGRDRDNSKLSEACYQAFPKILQSLEAARLRESPAERGLWLDKILKKRPVLWISGRFVEANRVAFRALSSVNTEPYLFVIPQELSAYTGVLRDLGVKEMFGPHDLANMMRELRALYKGEPLTTNKVEMSVGILKLLVRLINGSAASSVVEERPNPAEETQSADKGFGGAASKGQLPPTPPAKPPRSKGGALPSVDSTDPSPPPPPPQPAQPSVKLSDLGDIFIPDRAGVLTLAPSLSFDDAPWISSLLLQKGSNVRFVHSGLGLEESLSLGAKSLREQLFAGDEVVCPEAKKLHDQVRGDSLAEVLSDVLALADFLQAQSMHVLYDPRCHPTESLMHPGLAPAQGPAVVIHVLGPVLSSEQVAQALSDAPMGSASEERGYVAPSGKRLMSAFAVTDCLQIVSGREYFIFDPAGLHLLSDALPESVGGNSGIKRRAQRCFLTPAPGSSPSSAESVLQRFPHQFEPFMNLPFGLQEAVSQRSGLGGMIIRMPLRTAPSSLSSHICCESSVKRAFLGIKPLLLGSLLFSNSLLKFALQHFDEASGDCVTDTALILLSTPVKRSSRRDLLTDSGWKKNTISSIFTTYTPSEMCYKVKISTNYLQGGWLHSMAPDAASSVVVSNATSKTPSTDGRADQGLTQVTEDWIVASIIGSGRIREEALKDPYRSFCLKPWCSAAVKLYSDAELADLALPPVQGLLFNNGAPLGVSGLPFHIEGSLLWDPVDRLVPLTELVTVDRTRPLEAVLGTWAHRTASMSTGAILTWNLRLIQTAMECLAPKLMRELVEGEASRGPAGARRTAVAGFYKYWPYLSRMSPQTAMAATRCRMLQGLAEMPLFLTRSGFTTIDKAILPAWKWSPEVALYLQTMLPVVLCPEQLSTDFTAVQQRFSLLTPSKLRDVMRADCATQSTRLRGRYELLLPLLTYCISDLSRVGASEGEFVRRRAYKELAGVPLLPMSDGSVRAMPKSARERVCVAPPCAHALLPQLRASFTHPTLLGTQALSLLEDGLVRDTLYISGFTAAFLRENFQAVMPPEWKHSQAVRWLGEPATGPDGKARPTGRGMQAASSSASGISELLLFALWRDSLGKETNQAELEALADWPLVPVCSRGRRLLISPALLPHLFSLAPSDAQDTERAHWSREAGRMGSLVVSEAARASARGLAGAGGAGGEGFDGAGASSWEWVASAAPASGSCRSPPEAVAVAVRDSAAAAPNSSSGAAHPSGSSSAVQEPSNSGHGEGDASVATIVQAVAVEATADSEARLPTPSLGSQIAQQLGLNLGGEGGGDDPSSAAVAVPVAAARADDSFEPREDSFVDASDGAAGGLSAAPPALLHAVSRLGLPVLDGAIFEGPPVALDCSGSWGRRILNALHALSQANVFVSHGASTGMATAGGSEAATATATATAVQVDEPLLFFDDYSIADRNELLMEIYDGHRASPLSPAEVDKLKRLRLFTATSEQGRAVAVAECKGVYWCANLSVLDGLALTDGATGPEFPSSSSSSSSASASSASSSDDQALRGEAGNRPVILHHSPALLPLYSLVGVEELTAAIAVRKFTLPALHRLEGDARVEVMRRLALRWPAYRGDEELVSQLKKIAFVPYWSKTDAEASASLAHQMVPCATGQLFRRPDQLLSWTNAPLLEALAGSHEPQYFAPPSLRSPELATMCQDLGMPLELTKEAFLRIAMDIQADAVACSAVAGGLAGAGAGAEDARVGYVLDRGRRILRHVRDSDQGVSLFDKEQSRKLSKVTFVPLQMPVSVEAGGHVTYRNQVGCFSQTLSRACGALGFTVLPVLDDELAPNQIFHSSLGITSSPAPELVMRHLRLLTGNGEWTSVDRWNSDLFPVRPAFSQLFSYLSDHWKDLSPAVKAELRGAAIVPVGHLLVRASRLFFRLPEDLSPFMHETPRYLGTHEAFLKSLGVRETPSSADYCGFLADLAEETRGQSLNPNELRAAVAIVQSIAADAGTGASKSDVGASSSSNNSNSSKSRNSGAQPLFVPDEDSVLRSAAQCLLNDDPWLRSRAGDDIRRRIGLFILHPSLAACARASQTAAAAAAGSEDEEVAAAASFTASLGTPLSAVLVERLSLGPSLVPLEPPSLESSLQRHFEGVLRDGEVLAAVAALVVKARAQVGGGGGRSASGSSGPWQAAPRSVESMSMSMSASVSGAVPDLAGAEGLAQSLGALRLRFVQALPTRLAIRDPRQPLAPEVPLVSQGQGQGQGQGGEESSDPWADQALAFVQPSSRAITGASATLLHEAGPAGKESDSPTPELEMLVNCGLAAVKPLSVELGVALGLCRVLGLDTALAATLGCVLAAGGVCPVVPAAAPGPCADNQPAAAAVAAASGARRLLFALRVGSDMVSIREQHRGLPGERLTASDCSLLELKPFRVFRTGEVVACSAAVLCAPAKPNTHTNATGLDAAHAGEEGGGDYDAEDADETAAALRYAVVVSAGDESSPALAAAGGATGATGGGGGSAGSGVVRRLVLRGTGDRLVSALCTRVYSFKSAREAASGMRAGGSGGAAGAAMGLAKTLAAAAAFSTSSAAKAGERSPATARAAAEATEAAAAAAARAAAAAVAPAEVLGAVHGLLRRAGVPVSLEQKSMLGRLLELEASQRRLETELATERQQHADSREALSQAARAFKCPVCFSNDVSQVLVPCGHTLCEGCQQQSRSKCPFCRTPTVKSVKFFLPDSDE